MTHHILIVDFDIAFTINLKRALEEADYGVRPVSRHNAVLDALASQTYQAVVIDTDLEYDTPQDIINAVREHTPTMPIILTSRFYEDEPLKDQLQVQAFIRKPYVARELMPILQKVIAAGFSPFTAETRMHVSQQIEDDERRQIIEPMLEASMHSAATLQAEPPIEADDSTISEVINHALDPDTSQKIYATLESQLPLEEQIKTSAPPTTLPEATPEPPSEEEAAYEDIANATLAATLGTDSLDNLLTEIRDFATGNVRKESQNPLMVFAKPPVLPHQPDILPPPNDEDTRLAYIPAPPQPGNQDWIDQMAQEIVEEASGTVTVEDSGALQIQLPDDEPLIQTTLAEITQGMLAIEEDVIAEAEAEANPQPLADRILAHYAVQLTQFSLNTSSLGAMITRENDQLAHGGELEPQVWDVILQLINEGEPTKTRVLYRRLSIGDVLIYSIQTLDDLRLTLVFDAETSLKVIRKRASKLNESLRDLPAPDPQVIESPAQIPPSLPEQEPPEYHPAQRESTQDHAPVAEASPEPVAEEAPSTPPPIQRAPGTYVSYGCVWLVEDEAHAIRSEKGAALLKNWIYEIAIARDWDIDEIAIQPLAVRVELHVPKGSLPHAIVETLMEETAQRATRHAPDAAPAQLWSNGFLIRTPADDLSDDEVQQFIEFYHTQPL